MRAGASHAVRVALCVVLSLSSSFADAKEFMRGVNVSQWLEAGYEVALTPEELRQMRAAGLDHIRLPVDPVALGWKPEAGPRMRDIARLRNAVEVVLASGLDVVVDIHPNAEAKEAIENNPAWSNGFVAMWRQLALEFKGTSSDRIAFELLNEPQYYGFLGARIWRHYQERLVRAVRSVLPRHTIIVSGRGSGFEGLVEMGPLADPRLIYSFHYYYPGIFTHQGASWMLDAWTTARHWADVRYPARVARRNLPYLRDRSNVEASRDELRDYFQEDWKRARIAAHLQPLVEWSRRHRVRIYCGEFGVIREGVDPASRYAWLGDVRSFVESHGWGWAPWNYSGDFGITTLSNTRGTERGVLEPQALRALGLGVGTQ